MDKNKDGVVTLEEFIVACQEVSILLHVFLSNELYFKELKYNMHKKATSFLLKLVILVVKPPLHLTQTASPSHSPHS